VKASYQIELTFGDEKFKRAATGKNCRHLMLIALMKTVQFAALITYRFDSGSGWSGSFVTRRLLGFGGKLENSERLEQ
jgi:hypothetical protein